MKIDHDGIDGVRIGGRKPAVFGHRFRSYALGFKSQSLFFFIARDQPLLDPATIAAGVFSGLGVISTGRVAVVVFAAVQPYDKKCSAPETFILDASHAGQRIIDCRNQYTLKLARKKALDQ